MGAAWGAGREAAIAAAMEGAAAILKKVGGVDGE